MALPQACVVIKEANVVAGVVDHLGGMAQIQGSCGAAFVPEAAALPATIEVAPVQIPLTRSCSHVPFLAVAISVSTKKASIIKSKESCHAR